MSLFTKLFVSFLFCVLFSSASADQMFFCVDSRGVTLNKNAHGRMEPGRFNLSFSDDWSVAKVKLGEYQLTLGCKQPFSDEWKNLFSCETLGTVLFIDRMSKKYTLSIVSVFSYVYPGNDTSDIRDGVCENF